MPTLPFVTVDVFTSTRYAGNPLAIVLLPPDLSTTAGAANPDVPSDAQMQRIADEFNLSETIFVHAGMPTASSTGDGDGNGGNLQWRVRIFMVGRELPFAGHPTIGAAVYALSQQQVAAGRLLCNAGPIEVTLSPPSSASASASPASAAGAAAPAPPEPTAGPVGGIASAVIPHNVHVHTEHPFGVEDVLALQPGLVEVRERLADADVAVVSPVRGMNFVLVALPDLETLGRVRTGAKPRPKLDRAWDVGFAGSYFYVVEGGADDDDHAADLSRVRTRMIEGSFEDPATGSAACALTAYLSLTRRGGRTRRFDVTQGVEMGRESNIGLEVTLTPGLDAVERLVLSGTAVKVMEGTVEY